MARDPRYDILFESVQIGPVTAKNRFFQVPHCNGGGYRDPSAAAEMRRIKGEGGWGVIFTEQTEMHHTSEIGTDKLTDIRRQLPDEKIKYIQTISISIGNHSVRCMALLQIQSKSSGY